MVNDTHTRRRRRPALQTQQAMRCCDVIHYVAAPVDVDSHFWRILLLCSWYSLTQNEISLFVAVITALKLNSVFVQSERNDNIGMGDSGSDICTTGHGTWCKQNSLHHA